MVIIMKDHGEKINLMVLVYMSHKTHIGDTKVNGKMEYKMEQENKYFKMDLIIVVNLEVD